MKPAVFYDTLNVKTVWLVKLKRQVLVLALFLLAGCSGITPRQPYNHREEGPPGGLFSGPSGAWTIGVGGSQPAPSVSHSPTPTPSLTK